MFQNAQLPARSPKLLWSAERRRNATRCARPQSCDRPTVMRMSQAHAHARQDATCVTGKLIKPDTVVVEPVSRDSHSSYRRL